MLWGANAGYPGRCGEFRENAYYDSFSSTLSFGNIDVTTTINSLSISVVSFCFLSQESIKWRICVIYSFLLRLGKCWPFSVSETYRFSVICDSNPSAMFRDFFLFQAVIDTNNWRSTGRSSKSRGWESSIHNTNRGQLECSPIHWIRPDLERLPLESLHWQLRDLQKLN